MKAGQEIQIRSLHQIEELEEARRLESKIWGQADSIPTHQTITAVKNGGLVLHLWQYLKISEQLKKEIWTLP